MQNKKHYDEKVEHYTLMISEDGSCVTTKFIVKGKYLVSDNSTIPAHGQHYELPVVNYFEINNGKITKGGCWFDEKEFIRQISA